MVPLLLVPWLMVPLLLIPLLVLLLVPWLMVSLLLVPLLLKPLLLKRHVVTELIESLSPVTTVTSVPAMPTVTSEALMMSHLDRVNGDRMYWGVLRYDRTTTREEVVHDRSVHVGVIWLTEEFVSEERASVTAGVAGLLVLFLLLLLLVSPLEVVAVIAVVDIQISCGHFQVFTSGLLSCHEEKGEIQEQYDDCGLLEID